MYYQNTVTAIATPPGQGGIAVIRVSGPDTYAVVKKVFFPKNKNKNIDLMPGYTALFGDFFLDGKAVDEGIALFFRRPHSYTGEDVIELFCHGGDAVAKEVLHACSLAGAEPAGPGEFSKRAVINGKMSITKAEAINELISATSMQGVAISKVVMNGALQEKINEIKEKLIGITGHIAAHTDYPEEDVEEIALDEIKIILKEIEIKLQELIDSYGKGLILRRGVRLAIIGRPNVGKSTIFNLLSGFDRTIVTPIAGTTRDVIREEIQLSRIPVILADTAGLHETTDIVEAEGIKRSREEFEQAEIVLMVFDGAEELDEKDWLPIRECQGKKKIAVINKQDLGVRLDRKDIEAFFDKTIVISAYEENSRSIIEDAIEEILQIHKMDVNQPMLINERQLYAVQSAHRAVQDTLQSIEYEKKYDIAQYCIEQAIGSLAELTGENVSDRVVDDIFSRFCVGK